MIFGIHGKNLLERGTLIMNNSYLLKRTFVLFALSIFTVLLVACDSSVTSTSTTLTSTTTTTTSSSETTTTTTVPVEQTFTLDELQSDYDQLVSDMAVNPLLFTDIDEFNTAKIIQKELLFDGMTALEFYRVIVVLSSTIRCGHTIVRAPQEAVNDFFNGEFTYPIEVRLFDNHLLVVDATEDSPIKVGDEIISIDGIIISDLTEDMKRFIPADGEGRTLKTDAISNSYLEYYLLFKANDDSLDIVYFDSSRGITMNGTINRNTTHSQEWESLPPYESRFEDGYAVLTVREFYPYGSYYMSTFYNFFESFFTTVETEGINHVILDIRDNSGGDPRITSNLFSYLLKTPQPYFREDAVDFYPGLKQNIVMAEHHYDGNLYILINGFCFSSTGHFVALLKYQNAGLFIGEETNGSFICSDSSRDYTLSNTRLTFRSSTMVWAVDVEGMVLGQGIMPDIEAQTTFSDYIAGVDTVMMTAIALIESNLPS